MFNGATNFDQNISNWKVNGGVTLTTMFTGSATATNGIMPASPSISDFSKLVPLVDGTGANDGIITVVALYLSNSGHAKFAANPATTPIYYGPITGWLVSAVTDMSDLFKNGTHGSTTSFNEDISGWTVSSVTNMSSMFNGATGFNKNITSWDVSSVTNMNSMFQGATGFNNNSLALDWTLSTSSMTMSSMFNGATNFNADISTWTVTSVTNMSSMFQGATGFVQDIGPWERTTPTTSTLANVTDMSSMFNGATTFNQNIDHWSVASVTDMSSMFNGASAFNQNISNWKLNGGVTLTSMFDSANANITSYGFTTPTPLTSEFSKLVPLNNTVADRDNIFTITNLYFSTTPKGNDVKFTTATNPIYYGPITDWNVSAVTDMSELFKNGTYGTTPVSMKILVIGL